MHKIKFLSLFFALALLLLPASIASASAPSAESQSPSVILASINNYRAANGLYAYTQNSTLMALAQAQADYQASINTVTHEGPGGTRPIDRAYAANYGNGKKIFVSEIIYGGYQTDIATAVEWWKNSAIHNEQMLASTYIEFGAGIATDGEWTYFVAVMGWVTGIAPPATSTPTGNDSNGNEGEGEESNPTAAPEFIIPAVPVVQATAHADGSVIHIIRSGQALWTVGVIYGVPLEEILALNDLSESAWVKPGDEILVVPAFTATPTASRTPRTTATVTPSPTSSPTNIAIAANEGQSTTEGQTANETNGQAIAATSTGNQTARWIVLLSFAMLMIVIVGSMFLQKPAERPKQPDDVVR